MRRSVSFAVEPETGNGVLSKSPQIAEITEFPAPQSEISKQLKVQIQVSEAENQISNFE